MTAKEYLSQAYRIDCLIKSKLELAQYYYDTATKVNAALSDMPSSATRNIHQMDDAIAKLMDLKAEINADICTLVELQIEIKETINRVNDMTYQTLLILRYLCFMPWEKIAERLGYERRYVLKLHNLALKKVDTLKHLH